MANRPRARTKPAQPAARPAAPLLPALAGAALIAVAALVAYAPALTGGFILDDVPLLFGNAMIKAPDGLYRIWFTTEPVDYWPLFNTSLWLDWRLWGMSTSGYHVTNLVLHIATALLVWLALARLAVRGAFLAALVFAVHPVNVETVAWITQRKSLLALLFALLSLLAYLRAGRTAAESAPPAVDRWYWLSLVAFVLAMLSKSSVAVLPLVLLLVVWWKRPLVGRDLLRSAPFFLVATVLVAVTIAFQARFASPGLHHTPFLARLLRAAAVTWFYLWKALVPLDLAFIYPQWHVRADALQWWLPLLAAVAVTAAAWRHRRTAARPLLIAWLYFGLALAPVMGFTEATFMEHSPVADHYQHLALIGVVAPVAAAVAMWRRRAQGAFRYVPYGVAAIAVAILVGLTRQQSALYADAMTLFRDTLVKTPDSAFAHTNLGIALSDAGRRSEAIEQWSEALRLRPDYPEAQYNIAQALLAAGDQEAAIAAFRSALQMRPDNAAYQYNLGTVLAGAHQLDEAIAHLREAVRLQPDDADAYNNLANALLEAEQGEAAVANYERAVQLEPSSAGLQVNLAAALYHLGRRDEAVEHWTQALRLDPSSAAAHNALGAALIEAGQPREAIPHFEAAVRLAPGDPIAPANLAEARGMAAKGAE